MKYIIMIVGLIVLSPILFAGIIVVDNNAGSNAQYTTLQQAYDNALNNDTIYLMPSPTSYGNLTPNGSIKKLTIFGNGYFLGQNPEPYTKANIQTSKTGRITIDAGMSGTTICGLEILCTVGYQPTDGGVYINGASNIYVKRNKIQPLASPSGSTTSIYVSGNCSNLFFFQNWISTNFSGFYQFAFNVTGITSNLFIFNNFISLSGSQYYSMFTINSNCTNVNIFNNVLSGNINVPSGTFYNNIIRGTNSSSGTLITAIGNCYNNIFESNQVTATNGNQINVDMNTVFVGTGSPDGKWQLKAGSPALGAGYGGVDCGMFGGNTPYILSGIPPIPGIYSALVPAVISSGSNTLNVTIKIKANN